MKHVLSVVLAIMLMATVAMAGPNTRTVEFEAYETYTQVVDVPYVLVDPNDPVNEALCPYTIGFTPTCVAYEQVCVDYSYTYMTKEKGNVYLRNLDYPNFKYEIANGMDITNGAYHWLLGNLSFSYMINGDKRVYNHWLFVTSTLPMGITVKSKPVLKKWMVSVLNGWMFPMLL